MATKKVTKTVKVEEEVEIAPVIAGAIYTFTGKSGDLEHAICLATRKRGEDVTRGLFRTFGEAEAWYEEGSDELLKWKLVSKPQVEAPKKATTRKRTTKSKE
jgi:hypothetical protein|tara:strand:+ start:281 stop:586 length:306 start_codon:yes stop_codon:yes gene_type:complete